MLSIFRQMEEKTEEIPDGTEVSKNKRKRFRPVIKSDVIFRTKTSQMLHAATGLQGGERGFRWGRVRRGGGWRRSRDGSEHRPVLGQGRGWVSEAGGERGQGEAAASEVREVGGEGAGEGARGDEGEVDERVVEQRCRRVQRERGNDQYRMHEITPRKVKIARQTIKIAKVKDRSHLNASLQIRVAEDGGRSRERESAATESQ